MKFGHIGIKVLDIEKSIDFYTNILNCKILKDYHYPDSRLVFLDANGTIIELISKTENEFKEYGPIEHIAFKVDSLNDSIENLNLNGISIIGEPRIVGTSRIAFFNGPNNEKFEFAEYYPKSE